MVRIAALGDNVVDCYPATAQMFPGGNCVNVATFARRCGAESWYVGAIGADVAGETIRAALAAEGVRTERLRTETGATAYCMIGHRGGDRVFLDFDLGVSMFAPDAGDFALARDCDGVHVGQSSGLDQHLARFAEGGRLSYDFSTRRDPARIAAVAPLCFLASFSGGDLTPAATLDLLHAVLARGAQWVLVTRGDRGAMLGSAGGVVEVAAQPTRVVDTLGAGDAFIARVLVGLLAGTPALPELLGEAAAAAAETCTHLGAIGYPAALSIPLSQERT